MTPKALIAEGRRLARPCVLLRRRGFFLRRGGSGPAAIWHDRDDAEIRETGFRRWITIDARYVPGLAPDVAGFLCIYTDEEACEGGRIEIHATWPDKPGKPLYATEAAVLPPLEAVLVHGSDAVGEWLAANDWPRDKPLNGKFRDQAIVKSYERQWAKEYPLFRQDGTYAVLGGWHWPSHYGDWYQLMDEQLMMFTVADSEPWVEAWRLRSGLFQVIRRIS